MWFTILINLVLYFNLSEATTPDLRWSFDFDDGLRVNRELILDSTSSSSFVLDNVRFWLLAGVHNTFRLEYSWNFTRLEENHVLQYQKGLQRGQIIGLLGYDKLKYYDSSHKVLQTIYPSFVVGMNISGDFYPPVEQDNIIWRAGRFGIGRGKDRTNLREKTLKPQEFKTICAAYYPYKESLLQKVQIGINPKTLNITAIAPVSKGEPNLWTIPLNSIKIDTNSFQFNQRVTISTAIDEIQIPSRYFGWILKVFSARKRGDGYQVPCEKGHDITFTINKKPIVLPYKDVLEKEEDICMLKISESFEEGFVFGLPIFLSHGICFDYKEDSVVLYDPGNFTFISPTGIP